MQCANWHVTGQVPIDTLRDVRIGSLTNPMAHDFQNALKWHMEKHKTKIVDLVQATGVTRDVINKLKGRDGASTNAENAILIAAFYGKSLNQFIQCEDVSPEGQAQNVFELLTPEERQLLQAQMLGIVRARASRS